MTIPKTATYKRTKTRQRPASPPAKPAPMPPVSRFVHPDQASPLELAIVVAGCRLLRAMDRVSEHNDFIERLLRASDSLLVWSPRLIRALSVELCDGESHGRGIVLFDDDDPDEIDTPAAQRARLLKRLPILVDPEALSTVSPRFFRKLNSDRLLRRELAETTLAWAAPYAGPPVPELRNAALAAEAFQLGRIGQQLVELLILSELSTPFEEMLQNVDFGKRLEMIQFLARYCQCDTREMARLLAIDSPLVRLGLVSDDNHPGTLASLLCSGNSLFSEILAKPTTTVGAFLDSFLQVSPAPKLEQDDLPHLGGLQSLAVPLLKRSSEERERGINLMFHGAPGTGKTEFVRWITREAGLRLYEVCYANAAGKSLSTKERLASLMLTIHALRDRSDAAILLDEAEDVFSSCERPPWGRRSENQELSKAWMTRLLETNPVPILWTSNEVRHMDPAVLRRFSVMYQFAELPRQVKQRLTEKFLGDLPIPASHRQLIVDLPGLSPAQLETAARTVRLASPQDATQAWSFVSLQLNQARRVIRQSALAPTRPPVIAYDATCLNIRGAVSAADVQSALASHGQAALCFHGLPGTGKTEFARHLAQQLGRELITQTGSDLLSMWVGETEANIARLFQSVAERADETVLLLDEADTFLMDRSEAKANWERSQTNEFLARMESFPGIFICTTNLFDRLDPAILRRFQFRLEFQGLQFAQAVRLFTSAFGRAPVAREEQQLKRLEGWVVPADFANVARQWTMLGRALGADGIVEQLEDECRARRAQATSARPIGFVH